MPQVVRKLDSFSPFEPLVLTVAASFYMAMMENLRP